MKSEIYASSMLLHFMVNVFRDYILLKFYRNKCTGLQNIFLFHTLFHYHAFL